MGQASDTHQEAAQPQAMVEEEDEEDYDPYAPLDPHEKGTLPIKPIKKGRKPSRRRKKQAQYQQQDQTGWASPFCCSFQVAKQSICTLICSQISMKTNRDQETAFWHAVAAVQTLQAI